jgi:uncharacterized membrane protein
MTGMAEAESTRQTGMNPNRLESLADAIFAFAMTLLVLSINMPQAADMGNVSDFLASQSQNLWNFLLSFALLAYFWLAFSQQFHHVRKTDPVIILISILILLFVVLIPFSTSLMNDFTDSHIALTFFNLNLLLLSCLMTVNMFYVVSEGMLGKDYDRDHIARIRKASLLMPAVPLMVLLLSFLLDRWALLLYIAIPLMLFFPSTRKQGSAGADAGP